jgi:hypothetical protein
MADEPTTALAADPPCKIRTIKRAKEKAARLVREAAKLKEGERACVGMVKLRADMRQPAGPDNPYFLNEDGSIKTRPCGLAPIKGGMVCHKHGGKAPQVRAKANKRLLAMVEPSLIRLEALVEQTEHLPTSLAAIRTVLERAGSTAPIGPLAKEVGDKDMRPIIQIGIKVGGIEKPVVEVGMMPVASDAIEGELVDEDDE